MRIASNRHVLCPVTYNFQLGADLRTALQRETVSMTTEARSIAKDDGYPLIERAKRLMAILDMYNNRFKKIADSEIQYLSFSIFRDVEEKFSDAMKKVTGKTANYAYSERYKTKDAVKRMAEYVQWIPEEYFDSLATVILREKSGKKHPDDMTFKQALDASAGSSRRNVTGKVKNVVSHITSKATEDLCIAFGIDRYEWRTMLDSRVVGNPTGLYPRGNAEHMNHWERHGKVFKYSSPPADGNPGEAINCRCVAVPMA